MSSRMTSPPGVSTVNVVLASASPPALLTSFKVSVAQRWRSVTSVSLPEATLMSALTIEFDGMVADGAERGRFAGLARSAPARNRPPAVSR